jgi:hypothetical protein
MSFYEPSLMQRRVNTPALCPKCAKDQIRPILWGMPTAAFAENETEIYIGGCCLGTGSYGCRACHWQGQLNEVTSDGVVRNLEDFLRLIEVETIAALNKQLVQHLNPVTGYVFQAWWDPRTGDGAEGTTWHQHYWNTEGEQTEEEWVETAGLSSPKVQGKGTGKFMEYYGIQLIVGKRWCDLEFPFPIQDFWPALARTKALELGRLEYERRAPEGPAGLGALVL